MRILFVCESNINSPNRTICYNIAKKLSETNEVHIANIGAWPEKSGTDKTVHAYKEISILKELGDPEFTDFRRRHNWNSISISEKIRIVIREPKLIRNYILRKFEKGRGAEYLGAMQIKSYCRSHKTDFVVGVVKPFSITEMLYKIHGIKKALIQLDPYSTNPYVPDGMKDTYVTHEKQLLRKIDLLFTTKHIIKDMTDLDIIDSKKANEIVFPLIFEKSDSTEKKGIINKSEGKVYFCHAGSFYADIRPPEILIELFKKLPENYTLVVAGNNTDQIMKYEKEIPGRITDLGKLKPEDSRELLFESDFNISFNNKVNNMIPSKLFECINTGRPFINICQIPDCPTLPYACRYEHAYNMFSYEETDTESFVRFVNEHIGRQLSRERIRDSFRECTVEYVSGLIEKRLKEY